MKGAAVILFLVVTFLFITFAEPKPLESSQRPTTLKSGLTWNRLSEPHGKVNKTLLAQSQTVSSVCPNTRSSCPSGYFCVLNVLCLQGDPSSYSPLALISAAAAAKFAEDMYSTDCIVEIEQSITDLVTAFEDWEAQDYSDAGLNLKQGLVDVYNAYTACTGQNEGFWDRVVGYFKDVIEAFAPEVVAAYEIVVHGVNVYEDFKAMMYDCSDGVQDYIDCGGALGDMVYQIYVSLEKK
jgi:hypothetical protein